MSMRFVVEDIESNQVTSSHIQGLFVDEIINNRISYIFSSKVKFSYYELCVATSPETITTGRRPLFGIYGRLDQQPNFTYFRFMFNTTKPTKTQTIHVRGIPNSMRKWEENSNEGSVIRHILKSFTSAFKETIKFGELSVHCCGVNSLRKQTVVRYKKKKKTKERKRVRHTTSETYVVNVLPLGFKEKIQDL